MVVEGDHPYISKPMREQWEIMSITLMSNIYCVMYYTLRQLFEGLMVLYLLFDLIDVGQNFQFHATNCYIYIDYSFSNTCKKGQLGPNP